MSRAFVLLGDPIEHSISPALMRAAFATWGVDASYVAAGVPPAEFPSALRAPGWSGGNVTLPYKPGAARLLDEPSEEVTATGACNCFWRLPDGRLAGDNTDVGGLKADLEEWDFEIRGGRVLLIGAGGAARAALRALGAEGVTSVDIRNRSLDRARDLVRTVSAGSHAAGRAGASVPTVVLEGPPGGRYDLVVNATRLGLDEGDPVPIDLTAMDCGAVYDLVYAPGETPWVREARALGVPARGGLGMLIRQAALSLEHWFPGRSPPVAEMRAAAEGALAGRGS